MFILIDSKTRTPVPLPFHTKLEGKPVTIRDFSDPDRLDNYPNGVVWWFEEPNWFFRPPQDFGLELITESDFMAERS